MSANFGRLLLSEILGVRVASTKLVGLLSYHARYEEHHVKKFFKINSSNPKVIAAQTLNSKLLADFL